jgi:hypothetical protein
MATPPRPFFELQRQLPNQVLQAGILALEARFAVCLLDHLKCRRRIREELIAPLIILGLLI